MNTAGIINHILHDKGYKSYLEIGVDESVTFNAIDAETKQGVDPNVEGVKDVFTGDINQYINQYITENPKETFDLIFIDGMHTYESSSNDLEKSLNLLNEGGTIVMHDTNPKSMAEANPARNGSSWCGTVWKTAVSARNRDDLIVFTIEHDKGYTVIVKGKNNEPLQVPNLKYVQYEKFSDHRKQWLGLISLNEFLGVDDQPVVSVVDEPITLTVLDEPSEPAVDESTKKKVKRFKTER
jgi:hypothetical protein